MNTASLSIGAIELSSQRTRALTIGNSSATVGTLTLNGASLNSIDNVILRNASTSPLTLQNNETGSGKTMDVVLGNATDNVVLIEGTGGVTISSNISGIGRDLTLAGTGTGILSLAGTNTYTGVTNVNSGALQINSTGALNGTSRINLGTTTGTSLRINTNGLNITAPIHTANAGQTSTIVGVFAPASNATPVETTLGKISGAGNLTFNNGATSPSNVRFDFILNEASDYTGNTTINSQGGQNTNVILGTNNGLSTTTILTIANTAGAGTGRQMNFDLNGFNQTLGGLAATGSANFRIFRVHNTGADAAVLTINDNGNRTFRGILGSTGVAGGLNLSNGNNFSVVKEGTGTWTLSAHLVSTATNSLAAPNSYTGGTILNQGGITLNAGATLGTGSVQVNNTNTGAATDVVLTTTAANLTIGSLSGTIATASSGTNTATIATAGRTLTVNQTADGIYQGTIIGAAGNLTLGTGSTHTLTLAGANTYTGTTTVEAGTLLITGSLASSAATVEGGAAIGGTGTLGNGLTIEAGGMLDLAGATLGLSSTDILTLTGGSLTLGNLTFQDLIGWDWANANVGTYELIAGNFSIDWGTTQFLDANTAYDFGNGRSGYFADGSLTVVIIPEPGVALLGVLGLLFLFRRRR